MFTMNKKSILYTFIIGVFVLSLLGGCQDKAINSPTNDPTKDETETNIEGNDPVKDSNEKENTNENNSDIRDNQSEKEEQEQEATAKNLVVYSGDENAEKIMSNTVEVEEITPEIIVEQLENANVLPEGVQILEFEEQKENGSVALRVDFSEAFQTQLFQVGTAGEYIIINSVVNTFLDAYDADKIRITVEGMVLESGHAIYDDYLFFQSE